LAQVVSSLIANALEAMRENGQMIIASGITADGRCLLVTITDSGPGIDSATLGNIFKPFFTTKARGLGVGLPLAKRVIERFGGEITVTSRAGDGTSVVLTLPAAA
jgi:signal transduction histidine kinase